MLFMASSDFGFISFTVAKRFLLMSLLSLRNKNKSHLSYNYSPSISLKLPDITFGWQLDPGERTPREQHLCNRRNKWALSWYLTTLGVFDWLDCSFVLEWYPQPKNSSPFGEKIRIFFGWPYTINILSVWRYSEWLNHGKLTILKSTFPLLDCTKARGKFACNPHV